MVCQKQKGNSGRSELKLMSKEPDVVCTCTQVFGGHTYILLRLQYHTKVLFCLPEDLQGPSSSLWEPLMRWFSTRASLWEARGNQSWGPEEVLAVPGFQKLEQKLASMMFATVYQGKRGKGFGGEVEETSLHLVTGLSTLGNKDFGLQCVKSQRRWRQLILPRAKMGYLSFPLVLRTHVHTPSPRCKLCLWVRKTKKRQFILAPAWLQVRVKDHVSPWVLCKRLLWRGPSLQLASTRLPAPPPMLALYLRGLRKPQDYIKHSLSGHPATAINIWALKRPQGPALPVRDRPVVGWAWPGALPVHASGKAAGCPGDLSGQPSSLPGLCDRSCFWCYSLFVVAAGTGWPTRRELCPGCCWRWPCWAAAQRSGTAE